MLYKAEGYHIPLAALNAIHRDIMQRSQHGGLHEHKPTAGMHPPTIEPLSHASQHSNGRELGCTRSAISQSQAISGHIPCQMQGYQQQNYAVISPAVHPYLSCQPYASTFSPCGSSLGSQSTTQSIPIVVTPPTQHSSQDAAIAEDINSLSLDCSQDTDILNDPTVQWDGTWWCIYSQTPCTFDIPCPNCWADVEKMTSTLQMQRQGQRSVQDMSTSPIPCSVPATHGSSPSHGFSHQQTMFGINNGSGSYPSSHYALHPPAPAALSRMLNAESMMNALNDTVSEGILRSQGMISSTNPRRRIANGRIQKRKPEKKR